MKPFLTIIKSDVLQRIRSYSYLITLCASVAIAYTFVPEPNANYSTIRISDYVGYYNSAWFGYVTAIMSSIFLALIGFYLVNSGIKKDIDTRVGQIVASTPISNFKYLCAKVLSNFIILLSIVAVIFIMSIILFMLYNDGYPFELFQFITPYILITIPSIFLVSVLAVVFEVCFGKHSVIQNVGYFFLFSMLMVFTPETESDFSFDTFGNKIVIAEFNNTIKKITNSEEDINMSVGYVFNSSNVTKKFEFSGVDFPLSFIISRLLWILLGIGIIVFISKFFHRFDIKKHKSVKKSTLEAKQPKLFKEVVLSNLPKAQINYSILPLFKTEFKLLFRKGKKWLWIINGIGIALLAFLPIKISHQMVLPILWFLQVHRLSDITTKAFRSNVHYFTNTAFKPIQRQLVSQLASAIALLLILASPLLIRLIVALDFTSAIAIIFGALLVVFFAAFLGILSKGKKLFEVLFFMITYININGISFADYFGAFQHGSLYLVWLSVLNIIFISVSFLKRKHELEQ